MVIQIDVQIALTNWDWDQLDTICRRYIPIICLVGIFLYFERNFNDVCSQGLNMQECIIWTDDGLVYTPIPLGYDPFPI